MIGLQRTLMSMTVAFIGLSFSAAHAGEKYIGHWLGEDRTSIEILSTNPLTVEYCIKQSCQNWNPDGDKNNMVFNFPEGNGFPGAIMTMKRDGAFYRGEYRQTGSQTVFKVTLSRG